MNTFNLNKRISLSPLRLHSRPVNSHQHYSITSNTPSVVLSPLNVSSVNSFYIPQSFNCNSNIFRNSLRIRISPIKHTILKKYNIKQTIFPDRSRVYPSINKCNSKRCGWCNFLSHRSTITSTVNGRTFNTIFNSDIDWKSIHFIYVLTWNAPGCGIQYVGQTGRSLKIRFREHFYKIRNRSKFTTLLYQHFRKAGHSFKHVTIQPVEQIIYNSDTSSSFKVKARHLAELKWIKNLQTPFPLYLSTRQYF
jgi:hypothetical protein